MKATKSIFSVLVIIAIFLTSSVSVFATDFKDIPEGWSKVAIERAIENDLLRGYTGDFIKPKDNLSRAEMATIINRAFGTVSTVDISAFKDVDPKKWYYGDMSKAVQMGTFVGYNNKLWPNNSITRQEAFLVISRALKLGDGDESVLNNFKDKSKISPWAKGSISAMYAAGFVKGYDGRINPLSSISREEFAQLMDNIIKQYIRAEGTYTSLQEGTVMINVPNVTLKDVTVNGDLIIGDGVGDGDVVLDGVKVTGRTIIRGGGVNSIKIIGNSDIKNITIARVDGKIRVYTEDGSIVGEVVVDGNDNVIIEGNIETVTIIAPNVTVEVNNAKIATVSICCDNGKMIVGAGSTVDNLCVNGCDANVDVQGKVKSIETAKVATNAAINVSGTAKVDSIVVNGEGANIGGTGTVTSVNANANNVCVNTSNTSVVAAEGTTGVTAGSDPVPGGTTGTVTPTTPPSGGGTTEQGIRITKGGVALNVRAKDTDTLADIITNNEAIIDQKAAEKADSIGTEAAKMKVNNVSLTSSEGWGKAREALLPSAASQAVIDAFDALNPGNITALNVENYIDDFIDNFNTAFPASDAAAKSGALVSVNSMTVGSNSTVVTIDGRNDTDTTKKVAIFLTDKFLYKDLTTFTVAEFFAAFDNATSITLRVGANNVITVTRITL